MKKRLGFIMMALSLLTSSMFTVQASETGKNIYRVDQSENHGYILEIPNYIGETDDLKGYSFVDLDNTESLEEIYGLSEWPSHSLSIFLIDDAAEDFPINHMAYKEFGEHKADKVEITIDTASLTFNEKNVEYSHNITIGTLEDEIIDRGNHFKSTITPYFTDSFRDTCFMLKINTYFMNNEEYLYHSYQRIFGIALTPGMADEVVKTGKFKGQIIPGLKEKILEYRNGSHDNVVSEASITVEVNGKEVFFDVPPQIVNGRIMVPLRAICEALDVEVEFNDKTNIVTMKTGSTIINHRIGEKTLVKQGVSTKFDTASMIIDGRTLVQLRMIAEATGAEVGWIDSNKTVKITT